MKNSLKWVMIIAGLLAMIAFVSGCASIPIPSEIPIPKFIPFL